MWEKKRKRISVRPREDDVGQNVKEDRPLFSTINRKRKESNTIQINEVRRKKVVEDNISKLVSQDGKLKVDNRRSLHPSLNVHFHGKHDVSHKFVNYDLVNSKEREGQRLNREHRTSIIHRRRFEKGKTKHATISSITTSSVDHYPSSAEIHIEMNVGNGNRSSSEEIRNTNEGNNGGSHSKMFNEWNFGRPTCACIYCGALVWYEERNRKCKRPVHPKFSICCQDGIVQLPAFKECPNYLRRLLEYNGGAESAKFKENIRSYKSIFAFTSMGGCIDHSVNDGRGPYVFKLHGQNYHRIGSLLPTNGQAKFAQLYIYDTENEVSNRMIVPGVSATKKLDREIVSNLISMFDQYNELAKVFRMARDRFQDTTVQNVSLRLLERRDRDGRQYNLPSSSEIAAWNVGHSSGSNGFRDIVIEGKSGVLKRINEKHPSFMAMQYPILFPYAEDGYRPNILYKVLEGRKNKKRLMVTMREYYSYLIHYREGHGVTLLCGGRLFQQFLVDAYCCIEEDRLSWIRNNQNHIRSEVYRGLKDAITAGDTSAICIGK